MAIYLSLFWLTAQVVVIYASDLAYPYSHLLLVVLGATNTITFILYGFDKYRAKKQGRRISERSLHFYALIGGWPSAIFAQELFRHKTQKLAFRRVFMVTVIVNVLVNSYLFIYYNDVENVFAVMNNNFIHFGVR